MKHDFGGMVSKYLIEGDGIQIINDCILSYPIEGKTILYGQMLRDCMSYKTLVLIILNRYDFMQRLLFDYPLSKNADLRVDVVLSIRTLLTYYDDDLDLDHSLLSMVTI